MPPGLGGNAHHLRAAHMPLHLLHSLHLHGLPKGNSLGNSWLRTERRSPRTTLRVAGDSRLRRRRLLRHLLHLLRRHLLRRHLRSGRVRLERSSMYPHLLAARNRHAAVARLGRRHAPTTGHPYAGSSLPSLRSRLGRLLWHLLWHLLRRLALRLLGIRSGGRLLLRLPAD